MALDAELQTRAANRRSRDADALGDHAVRSPTKEGPELFAPVHILFVGVVDAELLERALEKAEVTLRRVVHGGVGLLQLLRRQGAKLLQLVQRLATAVEGDFDPAAHAHAVDELGVEAVLALRALGGKVEGVLTESLQDFFYRETAIASWALGKRLEAGVSQPGHDLQVKRKRMREALLRALGNGQDLSLGKL